MFFRASKMATAICNGSLTEKRKATYYLCWWLIIMTFPWLLTLPNAITPNYIDYILSIFLVVGGCIILFISNSKGDGKTFIERVILLSLPVTIQQIIIITIL